MYYQDLFIDRIIEEVVEEKLKQKLHEVLAEMDFEEKIRCFADRTLEAMEEDIWLLVDNKIDQYIAESLHDACITYLENWHPDNPWF